MLEKIPYKTMDDIQLWRDPNLCVDVLIAGENYLHDLLADRFPKCNLITRLHKLGELNIKLNKAIQEASHSFLQQDPSIIMSTFPEYQDFLNELNTLGTIGYGLWHLRDSYDSPGFRYEFKELSRMGDPSNPTGDDLRLRGQGFLFHAAGVLARDGFEVEFIARTKKKKGKSPDLFLTREGNRFTCEITSKAGVTPRSQTEGEFWDRLIETIENKKEQCEGPDYKDVVLIIDGTPFFHLVSDTDLPNVETILMVPGPGKGGPSGQAPIVRYDDSPFSHGLKRVEEALRNTEIRTIILWNRDFAIEKDTIHRHLEYRIIGTVGGNALWRYFPKPLVIPGPLVNIEW